MRGFALIWLLTVALMVSACDPTGIRSSTRHWEQARQAALDGIHDGAKLGEKYVLRAVPTVATPDAYPLGSVFVADAYPLRLTKACVFSDTNAKSPISFDASVGSNQSFDLSLEAPEKLLKVAGLNADFGVSLTRSKTASYKLSVNEAQNVDLASMYNQMATPECWADIANRSVLVLVGYFWGKEGYSSEKKFSSDVDFKLLEAAGIEAKWSSDGTFEVEDTDSSIRAWVFYPYQIDIPGFDQSRGLTKRMELAEDHLGGLEAEGILNPVIPSINPALLPF